MRMIKGTVVRMGMRPAALNTKRDEVEVAKADRPQP